MSNIDLLDSPLPTNAPAQVRLGLDIACTQEAHRTPTDICTQAQFDEWVDIFEEMFSDREREHMKTLPIRVPVVEREDGFWGSDTSDSSSSLYQEGNDNDAAMARESKLIQAKLRRFYAYWSLKEAYIKMVGEGLLASWLKELEFLDVVAPPCPASTGTKSYDGHGRSQERNGSSYLPAMTSGNVPADTLEHRHPTYEPSESVKWTPPSEAERGMKTLLRKSMVEDVDIELVAYDEDFLVATAMRGIEESPPATSSLESGTMSGAKNKNADCQSTGWLRLDIERDIRPCAEGRCHCLD
jgi:4'-phosphopantetheinyl transferase